MRKGRIKHARRVITLIFLCSLSVQAAQEIPLADVKQVFSDLIAIPNLFDVTAKMESRLTITPDQRVFRHGRFIGVNGPYQKWRYCFIVPAGSEADFLIVLNALVTDTAGHYSVTNNGKWFITNIDPVTMTQEAKDWCTQ